MKNKQTIVDLEICSNFFWQEKKTVLIFIVGEVSQQAALPFLFCLQLATKDQL